MEKENHSVAKITSSPEEEDKDSPEETEETEVTEEIVEVVVEVDGKLKIVVIIYYQIISTENQTKDSRREVVDKEVISEETGVVAVAIGVVNSGRVLICQIDIQEMFPKRRLKRLNSTMLS